MAPKYRVASIFRYRESDVKAKNAAPEGIVREMGAGVASQRAAAGFTQSRVDKIGLKKEMVLTIKNGIIAPTLYRLV